jgi:hypothetical protein
MFSPWHKDLPLQARFIPAYSQEMCNFTNVAQPIDAAVLCLQLLQCSSLTALKSSPAKAGGIHNHLRNM